MTCGQRYIGNLSFNLNLKDFPFDSHRVWLGVVSASYTPEEVAFVINPKRTGRSEDFSIIDFEIISGQPQTDPYYYSPEDTYLSSIHFEAHAKRQPAFYVWKVIVPLILISIMSWTVFWIDPSQVGPQIGISTASVLTLIIFQFNLGRLVPRVPYLMRIDYFSFGAIVLVFLALMEAVATATLNRSGHEALAHGMDRWSRLAFPAPFGVISVVALFV